VVWELELHLEKKMPVSPFHFSIFLRLVFVLAILFLKNIYPYHFRLYDYNLGVRRRRRGFRGSRCLSCNRCRS
jgi:hypothetical protein